MPLDYEYHCEKNGQTLCVRHGMNEIVGTWSELCELAGIPLGDTSPETPVDRLISGGILSVSRRVSKEGPKSDYDPVLHGNDNCVPCACGTRTQEECEKG